MLIGKKPPVLPSEITPQAVFDARRTFLKAAGFGLAAGTAALSGLTIPLAQAAPQKIGPYQKTAYGRGERLTSLEDLSSYNNFYEFGTGKGDPARNSGDFKPRPWTITLDGEVKKSCQIDIDTLLRTLPLEERIYRMRCVEGWSMVIPWVGFSLAGLIRLAEPTANAKYVEFISQADSATMRGVRTPMLDWPYTEGLRMDEAMHPLTILAVGVYGAALPNQNGAPIRLVVPWKYGFKGGKSIVRIRFTESMPQTTWMKAVPREYGFYANVNPTVDHPRWSQATERRIDGSLFSPRIKTQLFNGYAEEVGQMYAGMDLFVNF